MNSDAHDFVLPHAGRQAECVGIALRRARIRPDQVNIVSTHATGTGVRTLEARRVSNWRKPRWLP